MSAAKSRPLSVCVVSGTRADYGLLRPVMEMLRDDPAFTLQVVATAMHLSPEFGLTWRQIEADGFAIDAKVEMLLASDTDVGAAKAIGLGVGGMADVLDRLRPDLMMVLGDRFEALAAVQTALMLRIPVAHFSGGDITEGAFDDAIRHAITKMSALHFVVDEEAARRVRQMGEAPENVHVVGDPGIDLIRTLELLDRAALEADLGLTLGETPLLITFHPATLDSEPSSAQFDELLAALDGLGPEATLIFTRPNADPEGRQLIERLDAFAAERANAQVFTSLGQLRYLSLLAQAKVVVGNSSSGLVEAPALGTYTLNVGNRQAGRLAGDTVTHVPAKRAEIARELERLIALPPMPEAERESPYGDGHTTEKVAAVLKSLTDPSSLVVKHFHDLR